MIQVKLVLDGQGELDLYDNVPISLNYSVAEVQDITKKNSNFSKTITLPGTHSNNQLLGHLYDINVDSTFDINIKHKASLYQNGVLVFKGFMKLTKVNRISQTSIGLDQTVDYEVVLFDEKVGFFDAIGDDFLNDLDLSRYNHPYLYTNILATSAHTADDGYTYIMLHNGYTDYYVGDFQPSVYAKTYWDVIFQDAGYSYNSDFINSDYFKSLVIPPNHESPQVSESTWNSRRFQVGISGVSVTYSGNVNQNNVSFTGATLPFNNDNDSNIPYFDNGNQFNTTAYTYTVNLGYQFELYGRFNGDVTIVNTASTQVNSYLLNGSNVSNVSLRIKAQLFRNGILAQSSLPISLALPNSMGNAYIPSSGLTFNNVSFNFNFASQRSNTNDVFDVRLMAEFITTSQLQLKFATGSTGTVVYPKFTISIDTSTSAQTSGQNILWNVPSRLITEGDTMLINEFIPKNIKKKDFISSIIKMHNLYLETDENNNKQINIKTRDEYYSGSSVLDWTQKISLDKDNDIQFLSQLQNRELLLTYKSDTDDCNKAYQDQTKEIYGQQSYIYNNELIVGENKIEVIFSPSPIKKNGCGLPVPFINSSSPKGNIRILYKPNDWVNFQNITWNFRHLNNAQTLLVTDTLTTYPYAGHFDRPEYPTLDINFGQAKLLFYDSYGAITDNTTANRYYYDYVNDLFYGKLLTAYFKLTPIDILNTKLNNKIWIKDSYYYINRIIDYNPLSNELTKVELIKTTDAPKFNTTNKKAGKTIVSGGTVIQSGTTVGSVAIEEQLTQAEALRLTTLNTGSINVGYPNSSIQINTERVINIGDNNIINSPGIVIGNDNNISVSDSINFVIGSGNTVTNGGNLIIGNNITADTTNTLYTNSVQILSSITISPGATIITSGTSLGIWSSSTGSNSIIANNGTGNYVGTAYGNILGGNGNYIN